MAFKGKLSRLGSWFLYTPPYRGDSVLRRNAYDQSRPELGNQGADSKAACIVKATISTHADTDMPSADHVDGSCGLRLIKTLFFCLLLQQNA